MKIRIALALDALLLAYTATCIPLETKTVDVLAFSRVVRQERRQFGGILGGSQPDSSTLQNEGGSITSNAQSTNTLLSSHASTTSTATNGGLLGLLTMTSEKDGAKTKDAAHAGNPDSHVTQTSHSIIGTPGQVPISEASIPGASPTGTTVASSTQQSSSASATSSQSTFAGVPTEWKVLGIAVIAISFLAIIVLSIVFFDQWSRFLGDVLCCGKRKKDDGVEELVPDWEKRSWEAQLREANDVDGRYPSMEDLSAPPPAVVRQLSKKERIAAAMAETDCRSPYSPTRPRNPFEDETYEADPRYTVKEARRVSNNYPVVASAPLYRPQPPTNVGEVYQPHQGPSAPAQAHTISSPDPYDGIA